jgi:hypothetical protein
MIDRELYKERRQRGYVHTKGDDGFGKGENKKFSVINAFLSFWCTAGFCQKITKRKKQTAPIDWGSRKNPNCHVFYRKCNIINTTFNSPSSVLFVVSLLLIVSEIS